MTPKEYKKYVKRLDNKTLLNRIIVDSSAYNMLTKGGRNKFDISYAEMLDRFINIDKRTKQVKNMIAHIDAKENYTEQEYKDKILSQQFPEEDSEDF
jgi:hypothetical protein